jgi:hypothetical protein
MFDITSLFSSVRSFEIIRHTDNPIRSTIDYSISIPFELPCFIFHQRDLTAAYKQIMQRVRDAMLQTEPMKYRETEFREELNRARERPGVRRSLGAKRWASMR